MRTFIALKPDLNSCKKISFFRRDFLPSNIVKKLKIVDEINIHLTLFFLGNYFNEENIKLLSSQIKLMNYTPVRFRCVKVGFFPSEVKPRVIWIAPDENANEKIKQIYLSVKDILCSLNFNSEEDFSPHITLARVRETLTKKDVDIIKDFKINDELCFEKLVLLKSTLTPLGSIYEEIVEARG
ncbi:MAG: RNA 2',3'-cyclic phosphodiesterase [Elusimicrobiales bacterium]